MFRTAVRLPENKWKVTKYLYSCFSWDQHKGCLEKRGWTPGTCTAASAYLEQLALRLLGNKGKVVRYLFTCFIMFRIALRLLGSGWKIWLT